MKPLTPQEEQLMLIIWQTGKGFVKDYREKYPHPQPPYTTVATIIKKLEKKGYIESRLYGNTYEYTPKIDEETYKRSCVSNVVNHFFSNSYKELVSFFAAEKQLSEKELEEILKMIKEQKE